MTDARPLRILLVAPNVSQKMGGEAFKALMILQSLIAEGVEVRQVTHSRVRHELSVTFANLPVRYIDDSPLQAFLARRWHAALRFLNSWQLHRAARREMRTFRPDVVHFTAPISPILPYFLLPHQAVVIGPLNGNVRYPECLRHREPRSQRIAQRLTPLIQFVLGNLFRGRRRAMLLISGGERTRKVLRLAGCLDDQMRDSLDSGISPETAGARRKTQRGPEFRFVFAGRLVPYKGCDLALRAIALADPRTSLDVIGDGPERARLEQLASDLSLDGRVRFLGWQLPDADFYQRLANYRALLFPTLAEANGIIVQEAMWLGLPVIGVNWAGPADLFAGCPSALVEPQDEAELIEALRGKLDLLSSDPALTEHLSHLSRDHARARGFDWQSIISQWMGIYLQAANALGGNPGLPTHRQVS